MDPLVGVVVEEEVDEGGAEQADAVEEQDHLLQPLQDISDVVFRTPSKSRAHLGLVRRGRRRRQHRHREPRGGGVAKLPKGDPDGPLGARGDLCPLEDPLGDGGDGAREHEPREGDLPRSPQISPESTSLGRVPSRLRGVLRPAAPHSSGRGEPGEGEGRCGEIWGDMGRYGEIWGGEPVECDDAVVRPERDAKHARRPLAADRAARVLFERPEGRGLGLTSGLTPDASQARGTRRAACPRQSGACLGSISEVSRKCHLPAAERRMFSAATCALSSAVCPSCSSPAGREATSPIPNTRDQPEAGDPFCSAGCSCGVRRSRRLGRCGNR